MSRKLGRTEFWQECLRDIKGDRDGGIIVIVDAENARKGVGKTSAAVALGAAFGKEFGYELQQEDLILSGDNYLDRLKKHPGKEQPSVVIWDEAVGAGAGDSRRAMANQNVIIGRAWQTLRTKRIIQLVTLPDMSDLDIRLQKLADYRVYCLERPIGYFKPFKIGTSFDPEDGGIQTHGLGYDVDGSRRIRFPDSGPSETYRQLARKKDQLISADADFNADEALATDGAGAEQATPEEARAQAARTEAMKTAFRAVKPWDEDAGMSYADAASLIDYSREWVGNRVREHQRGQHQDIVDEVKP